MAECNGFEINTATTPKPWGAKEEAFHRDLIPTVVADTIDGAKRIEGHRHGKVYDGYGLKAFDSNNTDGQVTVGICDDDTTGEYKKVDVVFGKVAGSKFRVLDSDEVEFFIVDGDAGQFEIKSANGQGIRTETTTTGDGIHGPIITNKDVVLGALDITNDEYASRTGVVVNSSYYADRAFVVKVITPDGQNITDLFAIDNQTHIITMGGESYEVNIGGSSGGNINLGTHNNSITCKVAPSNGGAFRIITEQATVLLIDTNNGLDQCKTQLGTPASVYPITIDAYGKVFTRDTFTVNHTIYGIWGTPTNDAIKITMIGGVAVLTVNLDGTKDSAYDLFFTVPFKCDAFYGDGDTIMMTMGVSNATEVAVVVSYTRVVGTGCMIRAIPLGGNWSTGNRCQVKFTIPLVIDDPEFLNTLS